MNDDPLYKSGTSLEKTDKEEYRDRLVNQIGLDISDESIMDIGRLKLVTIKELLKKLKGDADNA